MQTDFIELAHINIINEDMVVIPAGSFMMGADGWGDFEHPVHEVHLSAFLIEVAAVTNIAFSQFVAATSYITTAEQLGKAQGYEAGEQKEIMGLYWKSYFTPERAHHPVVLVSWEDAAAYAAWAGKRLPTEAEFEKAARGGLIQEVYAWGSIEPTEKDCNFGKTTSDFPATVSIKSYPPNGYGLYDMCGNVWNWCSDFFSPDYYANSEIENPQGPPTGITKVRRGASFNIIQPFRLRCANRGAYLPDSFAINIGFRCAKNI